MSEPQKAGGDECIDVFGRGGFCTGAFVSGELFADETVEGFVVVEGANDVVAVAPHTRTKLVAFIAIGVGIADDVQPEPCLAFAVMGRCEEFIDGAVPCVGCGVGLRPDSTGFEPLPKDADFCWCEKLLWRHLQIRIRLIDGPQQQTLGGGICGGDGRSTITAGEERIATVESQAAFLFLGTMAGLAARLENSKGGLGYRQIAGGFSGGGGAPC